MKECNMNISFCIIAYNEENTISDLLSDLLMQTYPLKHIEVILVDGGSTDSTKSIMNDFSKNNSDVFENIIVLDNPLKTLPSGWNVALKNYTGEAIIRVDAHARIPKDFIEKNVLHLSNGEYVCGGYRPNITDKDTKWNKMLLSAETSMFGSSIAGYRHNRSDRLVNSVFHGAYRREVFDAVRGYDERLTRTEDNDIHYRIRKAGFDIHFHSDIISYQHIRSSLTKMIRQKYLNGYWIGRTMWINPKCFSLYHFVPLCFVLGIILTTVLYLCGHMLLGNIMWAAYLLLNVVMSVTAFVKDKGNFTYVFLPAVFFMLHFAYGAGTIIGILKGRGKNENRNFNTL